MSGLQQLSSGMYHQVAEPRPVILIVVDEEAGLGRPLDIPDALQPPRDGSFGLLVQWRVEAHSIKRIANRHDRNASYRVDGSQPSSSLCPGKSGLVLGQLSLAFHAHLLLLSRTTIHGDGLICT